MVEGFKEDLELNLTNEEIRNLSKNKLKKIVRTKTKEAALKHLTKLIGTKESGKMYRLKYKQIKTMKYLISPIFTQDESSLLMRLRTRCVNGIRNDFGGMFSDKDCPVNRNCRNIDNLEHVLLCQTLQDGLRTQIISRHKVIFEDIYSEDILKQKEATTLFQLLLEVRERILSPPAAQAGPLHCGDTRAKLD